MGVIAEKTRPCAGGADAESMHGITVNIRSATVQSRPCSLGSHLTVQLEMRRGNRGQNLHSYVDRLSGF